MVSTLKFSQFNKINLSNGTNQLVGVDSLLGNGNNIYEPFPLSWTTATRPSPAVNGTLGFNTDIEEYEFYNSTLGMWIQIQTGMIPPTITWNNVTTTSVTMVPNNGYVSNNSSLVTLTLPTSALFGTIVRVCGFGAGGWAITQNTGQNCIIGTTPTTVTTGSIASTNRYDQIELLCVVANTTFVALTTLGNLIII